MGTRDTTPTGTTSPSQSTGIASIDVWRRRMLDVVLWLAWLAVSLALGFALRDGVASGRFHIAVSFAGAWSVLGVSTLLTRLPTYMRGVGLYLGVAITSLTGVMYGAFRGPNPFLGLMMVVLLLALSFKPRAAWWALGASTAALSAVGLAFVHGLLPLPDLRTLDMRHPGNWLRVVGLFAIISGVTLACLSYLTNKLERAMRRSQALLDALAAETRERLEALERERALSEQLRQAQKLEAIGTLAGGIAHDFNNVLVVILNHVDLMRRKRAAAELLPSLSAIEQSAQRAAALTRRLLAFSRQQVVDTGVIDLDTALEGSLALIRGLLPSSIELRVTHSTTPLWVRGAPIELDQVLMNLCINARDAMTDGGTLEVSTSLVARSGEDGVPREFACLTVRDTGSGMPPEQTARIFDPFFSTKSPDRGTGLGLSVVHGIVTKSGGFIEVSSAPGRGTELRVFLPRESRESLPAQPAPAARSAPVGGETLLFTDDNPLVRDVTTAILSDAGYHVIACADGVEALEVFHRAPAKIDLLIADAVMPRMGGRELYDAIALERPELPCLLCSGYASDTVTQAFFSPLRREFLQKPFTADELLARVRSLLDASTGREPERDGFSTALLVPAKPRT